MAKSTSASSVAKKPEFLHVNLPSFYASIALIVVGLILMYVDGEEYGFGTVGLTLGAIVAAAGFLMPLYSIMMAKKEVGE